LVDTKHNHQTTLDKLTVDQEKVNTQLQQEHGEQLEAATAKNGKLYCT